MSTMQLHDLELLKDIPGYKAILKAVLKSQIQMLVQQLSESTGEETVVLSASIMEGTLYHMGSPCGRDFLDGRDEIKSQFLKHCLQKISWKKQDAVSSERSPLSSSHTEAHARTNVINNTSYSHSDDGRVSSRQVASTDMPPSTSGEPLIIQHSQSHSSDLDTSGMREVSSRKRRKRTNKRQVKPRIDADVQESSLAINSEHDYEVIINNESNSETNDEDGTCMEITEGNQMESRDWDPASSGFGDAGNQSGVAGLGTSVNGSKTHGPDAVISMLHHAFTSYSFGENECLIHADNCGGQNKNRYVIAYFAWRVMTGKHQQITYMMQVPGHARCLVDSNFAHIKRRYKRSDVDSLLQLRDVVDKSACSNTAVMYGQEDSWHWCDWKGFLGDVFLPMKGIRSCQVFRFHADHPGVVFTKSSAAGEEKRVLILRKGCTVDTSALPTELAPGGIDDERRHYLFTHIRKFVRDPWKDLTCPPANAEE